jgi:hypothetical protein
MNRIPDALSSEPAQGSCGCCGRENCTIHTKTSAVDTSISYHNVVMLS